MIRFRDWLISLTVKLQSWVVEIESFIEELEEMKND